MKRKLIAMILAVTTALCAVPLVHAQSNTTAQIYSVYGNGMLLQQNKTSYIYGTGTPGNSIKAELLDSNGKVVSDSTVKIASDGTFAAPVTATNGSFDNYTLVFYENGVEFKRFSKVVFGELWLANGQSNMQYPLSQAKYGSDLFKNNKKLNEWLRVLYIPGIPEYNGSTALVPSEPQKDVPGAIWLDGSNPGIYSLSAVAYYFAEKMTKDLDVPVGIINVPLGGTTIAAWLSREAIDSNEKVKNDLIARDRYIEKSDWNEAEVNVYHDMTTNYNLKMEAIKGFQIAGMIWYQGESDIILGVNDENYAESFDLLQRSYTELFNYTDGLLPIVYTQLASYYYSEDNRDFLNRNISFTEIQNEQPDSRAVVSIYDVPLTYIPEAGSIHPECKKEIGERMAFAAQGLVYDKRESYTAATVKSAESRDGSIYVTFNNTGDGLAVNGNKLNGFAVCDSDGIYVAANAEIVSSDTVRVWSDNVKSPVCATYAYYTNNLNANLYVTENGSLTLPVSSFITDESAGTHYWVDKYWADCDNSSVWHIEGDSHSGYYSTWEGNDAEISFSDGALNIKKDSLLCRFSASPILTYKDGITGTELSDVDKDYSDYGKMSFYVRNNSDTAVTLKGVRYYVNDVSWYAPCVDGTKSPQTVIPADGEWHRITLDLDRLYLSGNEGGAAYSNEKLDEVKNIEFVFSSEIGKDADLSLDNITFTPSGEDSPTRFDPNIKNADNVLEVISALVISVIGLIINLF